MTNLTKIVRQKMLPRVKEPLRYSGGELNAVCKDLNSVALHGVLCFPDLYDIGMSHHGLQILYHIVNANDKWALSRAFHPWADAEKIMRDENIPLYTLEYFSAVKEADWIGFSVQYELQYTNIVNMLNLAGLPILSCDRGDDHPIVIAGGPCMNNPEPLAQFIDAFLIGDGEDAIVEFCKILERNKGAPRKEILKFIEQIEGFYIPSHHTYNNDGKFFVPNIADDKIIKPARIKNFAPRHIPKNPVVPLMEVIHHRFAAEVMRGCTRSCRFCSAGIYYRPVREKNICDIKEQIETNVRTTGWRDAGLLSLSTADYSRIGELLSSVNDVKEKFRLRMSLPSTRIDALTCEQLDALNRVAPLTSFTVAPEAGSLRLRKVINKDFTDDAIYNTVKILLARNAQTIKLYFMIGLPTEREEDLQAIIDMVKTISTIMRAKSPRLNLHVSLSPFSPKANTPFQWEAMNAVETLMEKGRFVKHSLSGLKNVKVSYRDGKMTFLETVMARGDRRIGDVIFEAWKLGARFDGWDDIFNFDLWMNAAKNVGVEMSNYTAQINIDETLPWRSAFGIVNVEFLKRERARALDGITTVDCRTGECADCGACNENVKMIFADDEAPLNTQSITHAESQVIGIAEQESAKNFGRRKQNAQTNKPAICNRYRLVYEKQESLRFLGHMDMVAVIHRAMIAAGIPLAFSQGFNPHPRVSFGPPLPFGAFGINESFDIETVSPLTGDILTVNRFLPNGLRIKSCAPNLSKESLSSTITAARYLIFPPDDITIDSMEEAVSRVNTLREIVVKREKDGRVSEKNIRGAIINASVKTCGDALTQDYAHRICIDAQLALSQGGTVSCKPSEFINAICPHRPVAEFLICRATCTAT